MTQMGKKRAPAKSLAHCSAGVPAAGVPSAGVPVAGVPVAGVPVAGVPVAGVPVAGVPVAGVPVAGVVFFVCHNSFVYLLTLKIGEVVIFLFGYRFSRFRLSCHASAHISLRIVASVAAIAWLARTCGR